MVDFVPVLLLVFGIVAVVKPGWVAAINRRQKAAGTSRKPSDVEMSETYHVVVRIAGMGFVLFALLFVVRSW